ncbi:insulinase family protein, partial [Anaerotignum lactatifermentans]
SRENATKLALLAEVMKEGTKALPSNLHLNRRAEELYDAVWDVSVVKKGGEALLSVTLDVLKHIDGREALDFIRGLIREPLFLQEDFPEEVLERCRQRLERRLRALKDDPAAYARNRCLEETMKGEGVGVCADGYLEDLPGLRLEDLREFYRELLWHSRVYLLFCGEKEGRRLLKEWKKGLDLRGKGDWREGNSSVEARPQCRREKTTAKQARLVMAFVSEITPNRGLYSALQVWNEVFGGSGSSLLFQKIREEMGLCYEIRSFLYPMTGLLFVEVGANGEDIPKITKEVCRIWDTVADYGLKEEEIESAVERLRRKYASAQYDAGKWLDLTIEQVLTGRERCLFQIISDLTAVETVDIKRVLSRTHLRNCFLLSDQEVDCHEIYR